MSRTTVHLVRHGEVHNPDRVLYGRLAGYGLTPAGRAMAGAAADALAGRDVALVVSSPLDRARQTAEPIATRLGVEVRLDDRLVESGNVFEGARLAGASSFLRPGALRHLWNPFRPSWGEPYAHVARRMLAALDSAREAAGGREAVCVSHQLPIVVVRRLVEGRALWHRPDRRLCALASITSFTWDGDRLVGLAYREPAGPAARRPAPPGA